MLFGEIVAYPQPALMRISFRDGPGGRKPPGGPNPPPPNPKVNCMSTGTGLGASLGVPSVIEMVTWISGQAELSTFPRYCFSTTAISPILISFVSVTDH